MDYSQWYQSRFKDVSPWVRPNVHLKATFALDAGAEFDADAVRERLYEKLCNAYFRTGFEDSSVGYSHKWALFSRGAHNQFMVCTLSPFSPSTIESLSTRYADHFHEIAKRVFSVEELRRFNIVVECHIDVRCYGDDVKQADGVTSVKF